MIDGGVRIPGNVDRLSTELSSDPWILAPPPHHPFGDRRSWSMSAFTYADRRKFVLSRIMHRTAMSVGGQLPTGKTDRAGNANGKQQSGNEASRSRLQQIARAIISLVTLPSSVTARRKFRRFGFRSPAYSRRTLSLRGDRSVSC